MKQFGLFKKIGSIYADYTNRIKTIGVKQTFLTMGTPKDEDVLYKEITKREKEEIEAVKKAEREAKKAQKEHEKAKKRVAQEAKKSTKKTKSSSKKKTPATKEKRTTKPNTKKVATKTSTTSKPTTNKKANSSEKTATKKAATKTTKSTGSKKDAKIALYIKDIKKHYKEVDEAFVAIVVKNLGPSIYRKDAELVSCSDPKELDTVRRNFLVKKLGIDASKAVLDAAIQDVCAELKGVRTKYRATFYYALAKKFKKESVLN